MPLRHTVCRLVVKNRRGHILMHDRRPGGVRRLRHGRRQRLTLSVTVRRLIYQEGVRILLWPNNR